MQQLNGARHCENSIFFHSIERNIERLLVATPKIKHVEQHREQASCFPPVHQFPYSNITRKYTHTPLSVRKSLPTTFSADTHVSSATNRAVPKAMDRGGACKNISRQRYPEDTTEQEKCMFPYLFCFVSRVKGSRCCCCRCSGGIIPGSTGHQLRRGSGSLGTCGSSCRECRVLEEDDGVSRWL